MTLKEADSVFLRLARLRIHVQALVYSKNKQDYFGVCQFRSAASKAAIEAAIQVAKAGRLSIP